MRNFIKKLMQKIKNIKLEENEVNIIVAIFVFILFVVLCSFVPVRPLNAETPDDTVNEMSVEVMGPSISGIEDISKPLITLEVPVKDVEDILDKSEEVVEEIVEEREPIKTEYYEVPLSQDLQNYIFKLCEERDIDPSIVIAVIEYETNYKTDSIGDKGRSYGLMQIQPKWHQGRMNKLGCTNLLNPYENVCVGIDILDELFDTGNSTEWVLMAYNGGNTYANSKTARGEISTYAISVLDISRNLNKV